MLSKNRIKYIASLQKKKVRDVERLYIIEGDKLVKEFLSEKIPIKTLIAKTEFLNSLPAYLTKFVEKAEEASFDELKQISTLKTPHNALAVIPMAENEMNTSEIFTRLSVALDYVQDPGNLGTIIRAAAWFGIRDIICSENCVDVYNPKVIQASMGALMHVNVFYYDLKEFLITASQNNIPVFGTLLDGESIYDHKLNKYGIILLGNESKGISEELFPFITDKIMIPRFNTAKQGIDSLNVGMAASVVFSEFLRKSGSIPD
jgi:RNA methyltransferase, TrmH family